MKRTVWFTIFALILSAPSFATGVAAQQAATSTHKPASSAASLAGTWRSAEDRTRLATSLDESIWGPNASSVRTVEMRVQGAGQATISVSRRVVDAKGRTITGSASVEEAQIEIGAAQPPVNTRIEHEVKVLKAERRYPDDPKTRWPLDGLGIKVVTFEGGNPNELEVRVDTPEGTGSFWETLRRAGSRAPAKPTKTP
jgi:hypothetical protein